MLSGQFLALPSFESLYLGDSLEPGGHEIFLGGKPPYWGSKKFIAFNNLFSKNFKIFQIFFLLP